MNSLRVDLVEFELGTMMVRWTIGERLVRLVSWSGVLLRCAAAASGVLTPG